MYQNNRLQILGGNYFCRGKCGGVNLLVMLYFLSWMMVHGNLFHDTVCYFVSFTYFIINSKHTRKKKSNISNKLKTHFDCYPTPNPQHTPEVSTIIISSFLPYIYIALFEQVGLSFSISDNITCILSFNIMSLAHKCMSLINKNTLSQKFRIFFSRTKDIITKKIAFGDMPKFQLTLTIYLGQGIHVFCVSGFSSLEQK